MPKTKTQADLETDHAAIVNAIKDAHAQGKLHMQGKDSPQVTRAQATIACIAGYLVERHDQGSPSLRMEWHDVHGLMVRSTTTVGGFNMNLLYEAPVNGSTYHLATERRVFLDRWQEVDKFSQAEPAGFANDGTPWALAYSNGGLRPMPAHATLGEKEYWVRRI